MLNLLKPIILRRLELYVKKYFKKHQDVKLIAVAGSIGKVSTEVAIATVLSEKYRVRLREGYKSIDINVPLSILGIDYPENPKSILNWICVLRAAKKRVKNPTDVDIIIQELDTNYVGQTSQFEKYLKPDISVITAVSAERMKYFMSLENVAKEEIAIVNFSKEAIINKDDVDGAFSKYLTNPNINTYGTSASAEYHFISENYTVENGHSGQFFAPGFANSISVDIHTLGEHTLHPAIAAGAIGLKMGLSTEEIARGLSKVHSLPGRMNVLRGAENTTIIDDSFSSSPLSASYALRELYKLSVPQRIAVFGSMNDLGDTSQVEHQELGKLCDPAQLAWVITVGDDAEKYLAPAARARGCQVKSFNNSIDAGAFVNNVKESGAAILFKGSEDKIYLEEAIKVILHSTEDEHELVRQSPEWLERKNAFFSSLEKL